MLHRQTVVADIDVGKEQQGDQEEHTIIVAFFAWSDETIVSEIFN